MNDATLHGLIMSYTPDVILLVTAANIWGLVSGRLGRLGGDVFGLEVEANLPLLPSWDVRFCTLVW